MKLLQDLETEVGKVEGSKRTKFILEVRKILNKLSPQNKNPIDLVQWIPVGEIEANDYKGVDRFQKVVYGTQYAFNRLGTWLACWALGWGRISRGEAAVSDQHWNQYPNVHDLWKDNQTSIATVAKVGGYGAGLQLHRKGRGAQGFTFNQDQPSHGCSDTGGFYWKAFCNKIRAMGSFAGIGYFEDSPKESITQRATC